MSIGNKTNITLEVSYNDGTGITYETFECSQNTKPNYFYPLLKDNYIVVGLYNGNYIKYRRNENKATLYDPVENKAIVLTDRTYRIIEGGKQ